MIETQSHPAQSTEFLSRLHDGELSSAEAAAFESHRRECEECRAAVADYEGALAAYRATAVSPHAADLSARILRKIRAASPSRRPFGVMFGIDIRWAGALAAALLVVIIGAPVFSSRHEYKRAVETASPAPAGGPIPAYVLDAEETRAPEKKADVAPAPRMRVPKSEAPAPPPARENASGFAKVPPAVPADVAESQTRRDETVASADALSSKTAAEPAPAPALQAQAPAAATKETTSILADRRQSAAAPAGGEAGAGAEETAVAVKLLIHPMDTEGQPPDLARTPTDERLAALRGRTFLLIVESGGRVRSVQERVDRKLAKDKASEADDASNARARSAAESILREIAFQPGDRSRRLLVTVQ